MTEDLAGLTLVELLDLLEPVVEPPPVPLWPQTQGWIWLGLAVAALLLVGTGVPSAGADDGERALEELRRHSAGVQALVAKVRPAVVNVRTLVEARPGRSPFPGHPNLPPSSRTWWRRRGPACRGRRWAATACRVPASGCP